MLKAETKLPNKPKGGTKWGSIIWGSVNHFFVTDRNQIHAESACGISSQQKLIQFNAEAPECKKCRRILNEHNRKRV